MSGPSCFTCTWLHAGSPVGSSPAACEPEGKRRGAIAEGLWVNGWASYHGTGSHCFRAPGIWVLFTEVTEKAARAQGA